jgi:hypothetical protein
LDRAAPFMLTDPANPDAKCTVELQLAEELFEAGLIEIDEAAPIGEVYCFQISQAGTAYVAAIGQSSFS